MASNFSDVPTRDYTGPVTPDWWNGLKIAGMILQNLLGAASGAIQETQFTFANNQATANVTGLLFSSATGKSAQIWIASRRKTDSNTLYTHIELWLAYNDATSAWMIVDQVEHGDPSGLTLTVTSGGQVQYASSNLAGANYSGASRFNATAMGT